MRETASARDRNYLLRDLDTSPVRLVVTGKGQNPRPGVVDPILTYVRAHPGTTINALAAEVPAFAGRNYNEVRAVVVRLVRAGLLRPAGQVPLETVDWRYERVPTCDVCGASSKRHSIVFWKHNTPVVRCTTCGLLYSNPRWKAEHLFGYYEERYYDEYTAGISATARDAAANQARWYPFLAPLEIARQTGKLLDVGCATGEFLLAAQAQGWEVYGLEVGSAAAAQAARVTGAPIHAGTLDSAPFPAGTFDVVTLWDVLEHLQSPRAYIQEIARLLRPGGMLALVTPNIRSVAYALLGRDWWVIGPNGHLYYFAPRTLTRLLTSEGFAIHGMWSMDMALDTWQRRLRYPALQRLAPVFAAASHRIANRFLWGEELLVLARRGTDSAGERERAGS